MLTPLTTRLVTATAAALVGVALLVPGRPIHAAEPTLAGPGGLTLSANLTLADGKTVADGVVLLLHGTLAHKAMEIISTQQALLAERGISSLAPTLSLNVDKRQGMADCAIQHTHQHTDALDELDLWLDWLESQGAKNITVAGHSRGGNQVAWWAAERDRASVSRYVLIAPATWHAEAEASGFKKNHGAELGPLLASARARVAAGRGAEMMKGVGLLYCPGADVSAASFVSYYDAEPRRHTPNLIGKIAKPVLLVTGSNDTVVADIDKAAAALADGEKVIHVRVEGADHFFRDLYAEDIADAIAGFIEGQ